MQILGIILVPGFPHEIQISAITGPRPVLAVLSRPQCWMSTGRAGYDWLLDIYLGNYINVYK